MIGIVSIIFVITGALVLYNTAEKIYTPIYIDETNAYSEMRFYYEILVNLILGIAGTLSIIFGLAVLTSLCKDICKAIEHNKRARYYAQIVKETLENENISSLNNHILSVK